MRSWLSGMVAGLALAGGAVAQEPSLTAANGVVLPVPNINGLSCERIQEILFRYQTSGYRQAGTIPTDGADLELFVYEDALAKLNYETCLLSSYDFNSPTGAFVKGFN